MSNRSRDLLGIRSYSETYITSSISAGSITLDLSQTLNFRISLNATITSITINNVPSGSTGFGIVFDGDSTQRTVIWPESFKWPNGNAPLLSANGSDFLSFFSLNNGVTWYGFVGGQGL